MVCYYYKVVSSFLPGDALLFHCNVLHTSSANTSDTWRRALLIAYNRASNNPVEAIKHPGYTPLRKACNMISYLYGKIYKPYMIIRPAYFTRLKWVHFQGEQLLFSFLPPISLEVKSYRKEFALIGANSFL